MGANITVEAAQHPSMHVNMRCVAQVKKEKEKKSVSIQTILGLFVLAWAVIKETPDIVCYKFTAI